MTWKLTYTASAARSLRKLDPQTQRRIRAALEQLTEDPERGKLLQSSLRGLRSWRTGDFRIVFRIVEERIEIVVLAIGHRRDIYARIRRLLE